MNSFLLNRQLGSISHERFANAQNDRLLRSLQAAPEVKFGPHIIDGSAGQDNPQNGFNNEARNKTHPAGINSIAIDRFEGRYLLSAGADSSVAIWDLEAGENKAGQGVLHTPLAHVSRTSTSESLGTTHVSFYPFDSLAFLTSGYDRTLKLFSSETLKLSASFDLGSVVYSHSTSTVASHLLVACASQHPAVRLVDLRSGSSTHSLAGHSGSLLAVSWHPKDENILVSGATDGCIRVWDVRRSASSLGVLDMEDSIGIPAYNGTALGVRRRERGKAHRGAVNGLTWTDDGVHLVSVGHDERMRVWNMISGGNTLANFGLGLKNSNTSALIPLVAPGHLPSFGREIIYFPNPKEILSFDLHNGNLLSRLRVSATSEAGSAHNAGPSKPRTTAMAWRAHAVEMYSAHADGSLGCWRPKTWEDAAVEDDQRADNSDMEVEIERKRKREELDQIVRDLTKKRNL